MKDHELDQLMRDYEAEVTAYRRLPQSEPTALLDRAILTKARAAVAHAAPVRSRPPRWMAMAASFAGVAIAAGIGWRVFEVHQDESAASASAPAAKRNQAFEVEVLPDNLGERERALEMAQLPAPPPPPAAAAPRAFNEAQPAKQESAESTATALADQSTPMQKSIVPDPHQRADHAGATAVPERRQNIAAPASVAPAPRLTGDLDAAPAEAARVRDESDTDVKRKASAPTAQAWLQQIRQLARDRRHAEARAELIRFRIQHPDVVIPPDLRRYAP
jgi:hypothetical protein